VHYYGYRFYMPEMGRWASRDPIGELSVLSNVLKHTAKENARVILWLSHQPSYLFSYNMPLDHFDADGLYGNPISGPNGPVGPSSPPNFPAAGPAPIDCSGYDNLSGATCKDCAGNTQPDTYPSTAKSICLAFKQIYTGLPNQNAAACVATCLVIKESSIQATQSGCDNRNCARLQAHVACYAQCMFIPTSGMPPGAWGFGFNQLLPSCGTVIMQNIPPMFPTMPYIPFP
jgi:hypothetical protein